MPKRLVVGSIRLSRETKKENIHIGNGVMKEVEQAVHIMPKIGEVFDFTKEEVEFLNEHAPRSIKHPRNDEQDNPSTVVIDTKTATDESGQKPAKKVAGAEDI